MTLAKATNLKNEFRREFLLIYQLCEFSLKNAQKAELLQQTLRTILGFLNFIEQKYIFDTDLINFLVNKVYYLTLLFYHILLFIIIIIIIIIIINLFRNYFNIPLKILILFR